jgi:GNAT superfamily N-acetyltransferase
MRFRRGTPEDIRALNAIALAAKARWRYSAEQLETWRPELEIDPSRLSSRPVFLAENDGGPIAFIQLATDTAPWEVWGLWVHPAYMRQGIGQALLARACAFARESGQFEIAIDSDPNAAGFYHACGARLVGDVAAPIEGQPDRVRPQFTLPCGVA